MNAKFDALLISFGSHICVCVLQVLHNCRFFVQTFFIMRRSLGGHAKTSASSPLLIIIKFR